MNPTMHDDPTEAEIRDILKSVRTIALVGASPNSTRPSHFVGQFLVQMGYRVIPVNPGIAGRKMFGETVVASLGDIPDGIHIDMVDIFRRSDRVAPVVQAALHDLRPLPRIIWMQIGVSDPASAAEARAAGITVIQNRCPKIDYPRLIGSQPLR